ncbi:protein Nazo [Megachile rotundata]|uniref:protein Nazo n=1 Tax=Megachile rotundata TaxID=143995 RepID=UPI000258F0A0|nr:PREDICTED: protein C19orf12 homolog isoform X1 [Megachile rotundata]
MSCLEKMLPTSSILEEVSKLEAVKKIQVSVNSSIKYGAMVGIATVVSGILAGPVGITAGGILSSCVAGLMSQGEFKSVTYILLYETSPQEKEKLAQLIREQLNSKNINTMRDFILNIQNSVELQMLIVQLITGFVTNYLHRTVKQ